jgi:hypothetical protein
MRKLKKSKLERLNEIRFKLSFRCTPKFKFTEARFTKVNEQIFIAQYELLNLK